MEQAKAYVQQIMHGRGEEPAAGEDQEARAGSWGGMAQLVGEQILGAGEKEGPAGGKAQEPGLATLIGQQVLGAKEAPAGGEKAAGTDWAGMASGAAASFVGGGGGQGGSVSGATHEGTGTANAGLVDKLLGMYNASTGQQFTGQDEGQYDQLAALAKSSLGTQIGRELLKQWVKQRLGI